MAGGDELFTCEDEGFLKGLDFSPARHERLQEQVAGTQTLFIVSEGFSIGRVDLCRDEIKVTAAHLRPFADEFHIAVGKPHDSAPPQVLRSGALLYGVER